MQAGTWELVRSKRMTLPVLTRRGFLLASVGIACAGAMWVGIRRTERARSRPTLLEVESPNVVRLYSPAVEMGQGVDTSLAQCVAEGIDCELQSVRVLPAPCDEVFRNPLWNLQITASSASARGWWWSVYASARIMTELMIQGASRHWEVPKEECVTSNLLVRHEASAREISFWELAEYVKSTTRDMRNELGRTLESIDIGDLKTLGAPVSNVWSEAHVAGDTVYGLDFELRDMLYGVVRLNPYGYAGWVRFHKGREEFGGRRDVVEMPNGLVVVSDSTWSALKMAQNLVVEWVRPGTCIDLRGDYGKLARAAGVEAGVGSAVPAEGMSGVGKAISGRPNSAVRRMQLDVPFARQLPLEPPNATAMYGSSRIDIWVPTQAPELVRDAVGREFGVRTSGVSVHTLALGGGFGRKCETDYALHAVYAARRFAGRPVKVVWSREQEITQGFPRPPATANVSVQFSRTGRIGGVAVRLATPYIHRRVAPRYIRDGVDPLAVQGLHDHPYRLGGFEMQCIEGSVSHPIGYWRGVGHTSNVFFVESMMNEVAYDTGLSGAAVRLMHLAVRSPESKLLELASREIAKMPVSSRKEGHGRGRGWALIRAYGSRAVGVLTVDVSNGGTIFLVHILIVAECGFAINPKMVRRQLEGGILYGLDAAIFERMDSREGMVVNDNFDTRGHLLLGHCPPLDVLLVESPGAAGGVGELATPLAAPMLTGAIRDATGVSIRHLPIVEFGYSLGVAGDGGRGPGVA